MKLRLLFAANTFHPSAMKLRLLFAANTFHPSVMKLLLPSAAKMSQYLPVTSLPNIGKSLPGRVSDSFQS
jgi:hypothetical protein